MCSAIGNLPETVRLETERLMASIENAASLPTLVKNGARANGFTLGLSCSEVISSERCELLAIHFDQAVELRMRLLMLG